MREPDQADLALIQLIAHELRAPLTVIRGYLDIAAAADNRDVRVLALGRAQESVTRMAAMLSELSAADGPHNLIDPTSLDRIPLGILAEEVAADIRASSGRRISVSYDDDTDVLGDPGRLRQVIENLLVNATVYSDADAPIELAVKTREDHVELTVEDEGPGIPEDRLDDVFERWARIDNGGGAPQGLGLGLFVVREIVRAHDGSVSAEPRRPGPGARFVVRLPMPSRD